MTHRTLLPLLCLAFAVAAPLSAQTQGKRWGPAPEEAKAAADQEARNLRGEPGPTSAQAKAAADDEGRSLSLYRQEQAEYAKASADQQLRNLRSFRPSDVCFGRRDLAAATRASIAKAEKAVAAKTESVGQGMAGVMANAASGSGPCVAKTVLAYLQERGELASSISVEDDGKSVSIFVSSAGGPVLFKGPSESGSYAMQVLTYHLQSAAQPADASSGGCHRGAGKDDDRPSRDCGSRYDD